MISNITYTPKTTEQKSLDFQRFPLIYQKKKLIINLRRIIKFEKVDSVQYFVIMYTNPFVLCHGGILS